MTIEDVIQKISELYESHEKKYDEHATGRNFNRYSIDYHEGAMDALEELYNAIREEEYEV